MKYGWIMVLTANLPAHLPDNLTAHLTQVPCDFFPDLLVL